MRRLRAFVFASALAAAPFLLPAQASAGYVICDPGKVNKEINRALTSEKAGKLREALSNLANAYDHCGASMDTSGEASDDDRALFRKIQGETDRISGKIGAEEEKKKIYATTSSSGSLTGGAYYWYYSAKMYNDCDRVLMKYMRSKPKDLGAVALAITAIGEIGKGFERRNDAEHHANVRELKALADRNGDEALASEEKAFSAKNTQKSFDDLHEAERWYAFYENPKKATVVVRAEKRGDAVSELNTPASFEDAIRYYTSYGDKPNKAKEKKVRGKAAGLADAAAKKGDYALASDFYTIAQMSKKVDEMNRLASEKEDLDEEQAEKAEKKRQKSFKKGKDDLEKELGF